MIVDTDFKKEVNSGAGGSLRSLHLKLEKFPNCPRVKTR